MKRLFVILLAVGFFVIAGSVTPSANASDWGPELGILVCTAVPGSGYNLLITSSVDIKCEFTDAEGNKEHYVGETGIGLGVNLNFKAEEKIAFTVFGVSSDYTIGSHALAGKFVGGKASATVGVGTGVAVLIGGGEDNFTLQPLALEANKGFGAAAGLGYLFIQADKSK